MKIKPSCFLIIFLTIFAFAISCSKENNETEIPNEDKDLIKENITALNETARGIEKALSSGDQAAFMNFIGADYKKYYEDAVQKNQVKLSQFADVFKTRKLVKCDGFFAVFQVQYNGKSFEITMVIDKDNNWKLKDL